MKNVSKTLETGRMVRALELFESRVRLAEDWDVKDTLEVTAFMRSEGIGEWKDGSGRHIGKIPNSWSFRPRCKIHLLHDKSCHYCNLHKGSKFLGLETMDADQKKAFVEAYPKVFKKLSV